MRYQFDRRGDLPPVVLTWTHGGKKKAIFAENDFPDWAWGVFVGSTGMLLVNYGKHLLWSEEKFEGFEPPEPSIPSSVGHHREWLEACKHGSSTTCNSDYSGAVTETMLLGNIAFRTGETLQWDAESMRVANCPRANELLAREYREGWRLDLPKLGSVKGYICGFRISDTSAHATTTRCRRSRRALPRPEPRQPSGRIGGTHTMRYHAHHHASGMGHVYPQRFKSFPIQDDDHFFVVCRYVEQNALRAGLVERSE